MMMETNVLSQKGAICNLSNGTHAIDERGVRDWFSLKSLLVDFQSALIQAEP